MKACAPVGIILRLFCHKTSISIYFISWQSV